MFVKTLITCGLIYWLFSTIDGGSVVRIFSLIKPIQIIGAIGLHICVFFLGAFRWWLLFKHTGISSPFLRALPSYYLGVFFNNFLPTGMGGDIIRTLHLNLRGLNAKTLIASAIADRVIGLTVMLAIAATSLSLSQDVNLSGHSKIFLLLTVLVAIIGPWLLLTSRFINLVEKLARKYQHTRVRRVLLEILSLCSSYRSAKKLILIAVGVSVIMQGLAIFIYYFLGRGIGIGLSLTTYFAVIPLVFVAASLPISIGGLGVREGVLVGLLVTVGVDEQLAFALSLLYLLVLWTSSLPGAFVMLAAIKNKSRYYFT